MKKIIPYLTILATILCIVNFVFLYKVQSQINGIRKDIQSVQSSVDKMTKAPSINDGFEVDDPLNPSPNNLQDILNRINEAEENIKSEFYYRYR